MQYEFLSEAWLDAVEALRDEFPALPDDTSGLVVNGVVTGAPDGDVEIHFANGQPQRGRLADAPTTITVPYEVARDLFVDGDPSAAMQAFMGGRIRVDGDITALLALQTQLAGPTPEMEAFHERVRGLTAP